MFASYQCNNYMWQLHKISIKIMRSLYEYTQIEFTITQIL